MHHLWEPQPIGLRQISAPLLTQPPLTIAEFNARFPSNALAGQPTHLQLGKRFWPEGLAVVNSF